jgi:hypothetical protein
VHEVFAVENRNAWKILKGAIHYIIIVIHSADTGVRVKTGDDGILKGSGLLL